MPGQKRRRFEIRQRQKRRARELRIRPIRLAMEKKYTDLNFKLKALFREIKTEYEGNGKELGIEPEGLQRQLSSLDSEATMLFMEIIKREKVRGKQGSQWIHELKNGINSVHGGISLLEMKYDVKIMPQQ